MGEFSVWHWAIVLFVVVTLFGTGKLRNAGSDLGMAVRQFRKALRGDEDTPADVPSPLAQVEHQAVRAAQRDEETQRPPGA